MEDKQRDRLFNGVNELHAEGEQMKGLKRVNGRCSLTSSDGRAAVPAGRAVTSSLSLNCRSLLPPLAGFCTWMKTKHLLACFKTAGEL